jgi:hypothetical protein
MKTLTILMGNARGGELTWETLYKNLLEPLNSDLALCFGETQEKSSSLYSRANYVWEMPEYSNWREYYEKNCSGCWEQFFIKRNEFYLTSGLAGGIDNCAGSGAIIFAFRHFIKNNYKDILLQYDRIVLTRSDMYYLAPHPDLPNDSIWVPEGEDHTGITDRHIVFPSVYTDQVLGVVEFLDSENGCNQLYSASNYINPELTLSVFFRSSGASTILRRFPRVQFSVKLLEDQTRWSSGEETLHDLPNGLRIKYINEYLNACQCTGTQPENYTREK